MYNDTESNSGDDLFMKDFKRYRQLKSFGPSQSNDIISFKNDSYLTNSKLKVSFLE